MCLLSRHVNISPNDNWMGLLDSTHALQLYRTNIKAQYISVFFVWVKVGLVVTQKEWNWLAKNWNFFFRIKVFRML